MRNKIRRAIIVLSIFFVCCQPTQDKTMHSLTLNFQEGDLPSLHPHALMIYLRGLSIAKCLHEGLTRIDAKGDAILAGAQAVNISADGLTYTFTLRPNHWSDGTVVTAGQYEASWKEALSPLSTAPRADLLYLLKHGAAVKKGELPLDALGVKALDERTLRVELDRPSPSFLALLAQPLCAPLRDVREKEPSQFNGPFKVKSWKREDLLTLVPNEFFWDRTSIALQEIQVCMVQDLSAAFALYQQQKIDWMGVPLCPLSGEQITALSQQKRLYSQPVERMFWLFLNTKHPLLSSAQVRKALSMALERSLITGHIFMGGEPLSKIFPEKMLPIPTLSRVEEDRTQAKVLFQAALKELGFTAETVPPVVISYAQQANRKQFAEYVQDAWSQTFGMRVIVKGEDWNSLRSHLGQGLFEVSGCFDASYYKDPIELLERFTNLNSGNFSQWSAPLLFQEKIARAGQEAQLNARMALLAEAEEILMEEMPFIPLFSDTLLFSHPTQLKGYIFDCVGAVDFSRAVKTL